MVKLLKVPPTTTIPLMPDMVATAHPCSTCNVGGTILGMPNCTIVHYADLEIGFLCCFYE